jgi:hypothetical protein
VRNHIIYFKGQIEETCPLYMADECVGPLRTQEHGHQPLVYENHGIDCRDTGQKKNERTEKAKEVVG